MPLSAILIVSVGICEARRRQVSMSTSKVWRLRLLTPMMRPPEAMARAGTEGQRESVFIVDLHQSRHAVLFGEFAEVAQFGFCEDGGNEQDGVGAVRGGFDDVDSVNGEILAEH